MLEGPRFVEELIDRAPVLAFAKDREGRYLYVNRGWLVIVGLPREEVIGRTDRELFDETAAQGFVDNDRRVLETGEVVDVEESITLQGRAVVGHSTKFPLLDAEGSVCGVGGIAIDITARHEAQQALARSEERYRSLVEHSPDAYVVLDPRRGRFIDANKNSCSMFKMTLEQMRLAGPLEVSPPTQPGGRPSAEVAREHTAAVLAGGAPVFDWIHQAGDGELLPCRIWLSRVDLDDGPGVRASIMDLREIESVRSALERARSQLDAVEDALPQLVLVLDAATGTLVHCNRRYQQLLGSPPATPLWESAREACERAMLAGSARDTLRIVTAGGVERMLEVDVSVFQRDDAGGPSQLLLVGSDVTERRQLEDQLRQSRRLESLGRLAGGVAHDFNNMLTVILGSAEFLEPALEGDASAQADLLALRGAAEKAQLLTSQLLAFAKADAGQVEAVAIDAAVSRSVRMLERLIGEDVTVDLQLQAPDHQVMIDRSQLEQVIVNLAVNARDAMSQGGRLRISSRSWSPWEAAEPVSAPDAAETRHLIGLPRPGVELSFEDTGTGMPPEVAERAFEPFFTTKPPGRGTGLGLATVHGVVARAGGHVCIESTPGQGTRVCLRLPARSAESTAMGDAEKAPMTTPHRQRSGRVLLVEDDVAVCEINARSLRAAGHDVITASGPSEALAIVHSGQRFDVVVSDIVMPDMSGLEMAERLARLAPVDVLFVSGYAEEALLDRGVRSADVNLLRKPFPPRELQRRVAEMLG